MRPPVWNSAVHPHSATELFSERQEGNPFKSAECVAFFTSGLCFHFLWDLGGVRALNEVGRAVDDSVHIGTVAEVQH